MDPQTQTTTTSTSDELELIKRSNSLAIHLYKTAESDVTMLLKQTEDLVEVYSKLLEKHLTEHDNELLRLTSNMLNLRIKDTLEIIKKNQETRDNMAK